MPNALFTLETAFVSLELVTLCARQRGFGRLTPLVTVGLIRLNND